MVDNRLPEIGKRSCRAVNAPAQKRRKIATRPLQDGAYDPPRRDETLRLSVAFAAMMFLLRSAFWLTLVFSWMPPERAEIQRALSEAQTSLAAHAEAAAKIGCAGSAVACGAVLAIASRSGAVDLDRALPLRILSKDSNKLDVTPSDARDPAPRRSANSLTAADLAAPWRGRKAKPGA